jgi:NAD(P)-dependent dehydrogenase (short-subunit alcohol dehydrogenase family)
MMNQLFSLKGKSAVITGGGSGIGLAISRLFAAQGAVVHILDFNENTLNDAVNEINGAGGRAHGHTCSVSDQAAVFSVFESIGRVDILVSNAGIAHVGTVESTTEEDMDRLYNVNIKGVYNCLKASVPMMRAQGGGVVLNMASVAALVGLPDRFAYSMTKGAVMAMTIAAAKDHLKDHIRVNSISPARVHTPFVDGFISKNYPGKEAEMFEKLSKTQPIGRMAKPEEIAHLALYLCSDEASFITGCDYPIDGGFVKLNN